MSRRESAQRSSETERRNRTGYRYGRVVATPDSSDTSGAYDYSDLRRGNNPWLIRWLVHLVYWPCYLLFAFPYQYIYRTLRWTYVRRHFSPAGRLGCLVSDAMTNMTKLAFLFNRDRARVYLRASRLYTPAQVFPFLAGTAPEMEDSSVRNPGRPDNWNEIRTTVFKRDNYCCVNCGKGGGPNGDAELHPDHVLPRSRGGPDTAENLRTLCRRCHEARHARKFN